MHWSCTLTGTDRFKNMLKDSAGSRDIIMKVSAPGSENPQNFRFYPYHYAPFASDLNGLADLEITFFLGHPFKPLDQLMGTLPASSSEVLPKRYGDLMTNPASPLNSFYPEDFEIDMNGKRFAWQGVAKLPFIDERRLLSETRKLEDSLTEEEKFRNKIMFDIIYVNINHPLAIQVASLYQMISQLGMQGAFQIKIDTTLSGGMNGFLCLTERNIYSSSVYNLNNNFVLNATYFNPLPHPHIPEPPKHVFFPAKVLWVKGDGYNTSLVCDGCGTTSMENWYGTNLIKIGYDVGFTGEGYDCCTNHMVDNYGIGFMCGNYANLALVLGTGVVGGGANDIVGTMGNAKDCIFPIVFLMIFIIRSLTLLPQHLEQFLHSLL
ncbi:hypothetical protein IEQ34_002033 [Dendrobium chrysotoxum]|uniref:Xrn1 helical domain-containing protein n=1 Tax=Dendrobium chrysotoxum TaxID=161865 RepID=A0AAV7HJN2_DENCH|nr:hypothetical protein IEQ34_002033 [Dendrobium chrysotoxum]